MNKVRLVGRELDDTLPPANDSITTPEPGIQEEKNGQQISEVIENLFDSNNMSEK